MPPRRRPVRRARGRKKPTGFDLRRAVRTVVMSLLAVALLSILYLLMSRGEGSRKGESTLATPTMPADGAAGEPAPVPSTEAVADGVEEGESTTYDPTPKSPAPSTHPPAPPLLPGEGARIALVIDDLGRSLTDVDKLERLGVPITYAVLPFETKTAQVTAKLRALGAEILLHLPMEPGGGANPGPGALRVSMTRNELAQATRQALQAVPGAVGVNNHMGSRLTADAGAMTAILGELQGRNLFFLDSRTSAASTGYDTARSLGLASAKRQVFLDPDPSIEEIRYQFHRLLSLARQHGAAIAIGHPYPATFEALATEVPRAQALGYEFVRASYLVDQPGGPPI